MAVRLAMHRLRLYCRMIMWLVPMRRVPEASVNEPVSMRLVPMRPVPRLFLQITACRKNSLFSKKKRADQTVLAPSVAYASTAQVTAFAARLDSAVAVNAKTQRHIAELMTLMSEVARTVTTDVSKPTRKRLRRSKWLFHGCLVGFGVGWFLLFPSGHGMITQLAAFLAK